ncbi:hypothetical protein BH11ARM2_BH11ARM2_33700 [soil metagenome]
MTVAIVGAGIAGSSAAFALSRRDHRVTVYEQFASGHRRGSSHGPSRIVRKAYDDSAFTEIAAEAYPLWSELDREAGGGVLHEVGLLYFGHRDSSNLAEVASGLRRIAEPFEILDSHRTGEVAPALRLSPEEIGIFTPAAGWVHADRALAATIALAEKAGAKFLWNVPVRPDALPEADAVVVASGPFVRDFLPDLPARPTHQTVGYLPIESPGTVWIEDSDDFLYGFPSHDGLMKVAPHTPGCPINPHEDPLPPEAAQLAMIHDLAYRRFGYDGPLAKTEVCRYTNLPEDRFYFGELAPNTLLVSVGSGHAFKFGPWTGERIADWVEGERGFARGPWAFRGV